MPDSNSLFMAAVSAVATGTILQLTTQNVKDSSDIPTREIRRSLTTMTKNVVW